MRRQSPRAVFISGGLLLVVGLLGASTLRPAYGEEDGADIPPSVVYRRIFVPTSDPSVWPRDGEKFLPVEAGDFHAWVAAANRAAHASGPASAAAATIAEAVYSARLEGERLVDGRGEWTVRLHTKGPAFLPLGETSLVIREPRWRGDAKRPARLGAWGRKGRPPEMFGLEAPESGTLDFGWHAPARATPGRIEIPWRPPAATSTRLILDLPDGMEPSLDGSVAVSHADLPLLGEGDGRQQPAASQPLVRWELAVGHVPHATLRIESRGQSKIRRGESQETRAREGASTLDFRRGESSTRLSTIDLTAVHEEFHYHFAQRGLDVVASWRFDEPIASRRRLIVPLPPGVQLVSASADGGELSWRVVPGDAPETAQAVIQLPDATGTRPPVVVLRAWQELVSGQPWRLPKLRPAGVAWASGTVQLSIDGALELRGLVPAGYLQTGVSLSDPTGNDPETFAFAEYAPDASLEVIVGHRPTEAVVRLGSTLTIGDPDIAGRLVTQLDVARGSVHALSGALAPGWTVEAVETSPANALREWYVAWQGGHRHLVVQLAQSARPARPVAVVVIGRLQRVRINEPLAAKTLGIVEWRDVRVAMHLLSTRAGQPLRVDTIGRLPIVAPDPWREEDRRLFDDAMEGPVFDLASASADAALRLPGFPNSDVGLGDARSLVPTEAGQSARSSPAAAGNPQSEIAPPQPPDATDRIVVGGLDLESYYEADGRAAHRATYHLENRGVASIRVKLAGGARLERAEVNGLPIENFGSRNEEVAPSVVAVHAAIPQSARSSPTSAGNPQWVEIPVPRDERLITVLLSIASEQPPLANGRRLRPPLEDGELPPLAGEWTIRLPDEFAAVGDGLLPADGPFDWRRRLFGPLAKVGAGQVPEFRNASDSPLAGWRAYQFPFVARGPQPIVVTHPPAMTAWSVALFLFALVGGMKLRRRRELFILLAATLASLCLVLPAFLVPLATGGFLGLLFSLIGPWPRPAANEQNATKTWHAVSTAGATGVAWLAVVVFAASAAQPAADSDRPATIHRVLIPVDADGQVVGSKVYVSERFLGQLLRDAADGEPVGGGWLLRDAAYHGALLERSADGGDPGLVVGGWSMTLDVEVLTRDTTIELPLVRDQAEWSNASLDGIPVPLAWRDGPRGCTIAVTEPGRYELTIAFMPRIRATAWRSQIELTLPPLPGATLSLDYPAALTGLELSGTVSDFESRPADLDSSVRGPESTGDETSVSTTSRDELDASGRLVVGWPTQDLPGADALDLRVVEMHWLHVDDRGAVLQAKYVVDGAQRPTALTIIADPRWELLTDGNSSATVRSDSSDRQSIRVALPADGGDRSAAALRFRLNGAPLDRASAAGGLPGELRLPSIKLASLPVAERWLAVSSGPAYECEIVGRDPPAARSVDDFLTAWGERGVAGEESDVATGEHAEANNALDGNVVPQLVAVVENAERPAWRVAVRPRHSASSIDELLHVAAEKDQLRVQFQADVLPGSSHCFQLPLTVSPELTIDQLTLTRAGVPVPIRWVRQTDRRVQVFFGEKVSEAYRLVLSGRVPLGPSGSCTLPHIVVAGRDAPLTRVRLYRDEQVLVEVHGPAELATAAAGAPRPGWNVRPLGGYQISRAAAGQVRLAIAPNEVETEGETLTTLTLEEGRWWATWNGRLRVRRGTLDTLRLRVPATWAGPFDVSPAAAVDVTPHDNGQATLAVRLPDSSPAGDVVEVQIRGPLLSDDVGDLVVPNITSEDAANWRSYVTVPDVQELQPGNWTAAGVRRAPTPLGLRPAVAADSLDPPSVSRTRSYRVTDLAFRVAQRRLANERSMASVRMADTVALEGFAGDRVTATHFVLAPAGLVECHFELPSGQQLVSVNLDGRPATIRARASRHWALSLGPVQLPRLLEIVTRSATDGDSGRSREISRPTLLADDAPLPVELSVWSLGRPSNAVRPRVIGASPMTASDHAALRFERLVGIVEAATPIAADAPLRAPDERAAAAGEPDNKATSDVSGWFRAWDERLKSLRQQALTSLLPRDVGQPASQVARTAEEQIAGASQRLDAWTTAWRKNDEVRMTNDEANYFAHASFVIPHSYWTYCVADGAADHLTVERSPDAATSGPVRAGGLLVLFGLTATALWWARRPAVADLWWRWPHIAGVLFGLAYGAWLRPGWLGWLIVAASLLLMVRPGWPCPSFLGEDTTVLRVGRPK